MASKHTTVVQVNLCFPHISQSSQRRVGGGASEGGSSSSESNSTFSSLIHWPLRSCSHPSLQKQNAQRIMRLILNWHPIVRIYNSSSHCYVPAQIRKQFCTFSVWGNARALFSSGVWYDLLPVSLQAEILPCVLMDATHYWLRKTKRVHT